MITGFDLDGFKDILSAVDNINSAFESELPDGRFVPFEVTQCEGYECIRLANRYLSKKTHDNHNNNESLATIDPHNILKKAAGTKFTHTEENSVKYYRKRQLLNVNGEM